MRLLPSDPDIQTLYGRIVQKKIDLQPDFQRGEVWTEEKKKTLIDTILRGWHVPPIHIVVVEDTGAQEVLDGQQRLVAIRDFIAGEFAVNGYCDPLNENMQAIDGLFYKELPEKLKNNFDNYAIRQFLIVDFEPGEPGELFHRLNQHVRLTPAEKRNAFYGPIRAQVKELVALMGTLGIDKNNLGFSNSRMAYDDVLSKFLIFLERRSLREKVTETDVTSLFRREEGFEKSLIDEATHTLECFAKVLLALSSNKVKFNKATFLSWLLFIYRASGFFCNESGPKEFLGAFESLRSSIRRGSDLHDFNNSTVFERLLYEQARDLIDLYNDRSSSRVADVSSVLSRDFVLHLCLFKYVEDFDDPYLGGLLLTQEELSLLKISNKKSNVLANNVFVNQFYDSDMNVINFAPQDYSTVSDIPIDLDMILARWGDWR